MKGMISLVDFIKEVKKELRAAVDEDDPFFEMGDVELEVTFALDASAKAGAKLFIVDIGGETKATQSHKITVKLHPFLESDSSQQITTERLQKGVGMITPYKGSKKQRAKKTTEPHSTSTRAAPTAHNPSQGTPVRSKPTAG